MSCYNKVFRNTRGEIHEEIQTELKAVLILSNASTSGNHRHNIFPILTLWNRVIFKYAVWSCPDSHQVFLTLPTKQIQTAKNFSVAMSWYNTVA